MGKQREGLGKCLSSEVFVPKEVSERHLDNSLETAARSVVWLPSVKTSLEVLHVRTGYFQLTRRRLGIKDRREDILKKFQNITMDSFFSYKLVKTYPWLWGPHNELLDLFLLEHLCALFSLC